jgi:hypothetical protein
VLNLLRGRKKANSIDNVITVAIILERLNMKYKTSRCRLE